MRAVATSCAIAAPVECAFFIDEMVRLIRAAGFTPVQRDTVYGEVRRFAAE